MCGLGLSECLCADLAGWWAGGPLRPRASAHGGCLALRPGAIVLIPGATWMLVAVGERSWTATSIHVAVQGWVGVALMTAEVGVELGFR
jgi:hypothetical protein